MSADRLYPQRPLIGAGVVVLDPAGQRVLLIRRARPPRAGQWSIPGGLVELGETVEAAARREVLEETGIVLGALHLLAVVDIIEHDPDRRVRVHYSLIDFAGRTERADPKTVLCRDEVMEARWFASEELGELGLWSETERVISLALAAPRP
jgi:8-oxo-dGTP diphosphatase